MTTKAEATAQALAALEERRHSFIDAQIDNSRLPVGSPMYYYCHGCGKETAIKDEGWYIDPPTRFCDDCEVLVQIEEMSAKGEPYDDWLRARGHAPVPR